MASHSGYPHMSHTLHPQLGTHLPPPPHSAVQTPDLKLPSLRSLNFAYPPVGEPGSASAEGPSQTPQRSEPQPRAQFAPQDEYYHTRDMPYYQEAASSSSSSHLGPPAPPPKRPRSASNSGGRSPFALQPPHAQHSPPGTYSQHDAPGRSSASYAQGHQQVHSQAHQQYTHAQPEPAHLHPPPPTSSLAPPYFTRLPQPSQSQGWYYSSGNQPGQAPSQQQQQQHPQHPQHQQQQQQQQHPQQQSSLQNAPQKHSIPFQPYPPNPHPHSHPHSPHQAPGQAPPPRASASFAVAPPSQQQQHATASSSGPSNSNPGVILGGPGSASTTTANTTAQPFGSSPPTPGFAVPGTLGAANVRGVEAKVAAEDPERAAAAGMHLSKIMEHCTALCEFANHYAQHTDIRPSPAEVAEMAQRATLVLQLVEHLRRLAEAQNSPGSGSSAMFPTPVMMDRERERERESGEEKARVGAGMAGMGMGSKKRPWEDAVTSQGSADDGGGERSGDDNTLSPPSFEMKDSGMMRSVAETDMAIIRSKRGQGQGGAGAPPGAVKAKYRKRSRATPPGKCHSCNIRETPEWRRGPDGARTLCNACGLHYAKLLRKRDKTLGSGGDSDAPPIDLEMLRASTRLSGDQPGPKPSMHPADSDAAFRDAGEDMAEIQLQPVRLAPPQMGVAMQVHQWTPPHQHREEVGGGYELAAYSTSLMRSSNARGSPA